MALKDFYIKSCSFDTKNYKHERAKIKTDPELHDEVFSNLTHYVQKNTK
jgi:hypothetical protein